MSLDTKARFMDLQRRFAAGLQKRWEEIRAADDGPSLQSALHRLVGSAASYGFERIGQCAREAEALAMLEPNAALSQALAQLESEIRLAHGE
jgi:HPt (histidine-containing phosphotransfer) domain-containing protein